MTLLKPGDRVSDTLVVDRLLGEGSFAEVHRVRHEYLGPQAMKLFKKVASRAETRAMLDEARLLSTLGHPNVVRFFEASTVRTAEGLRGFFTMEYVPGGNLERFAAGHRPAMPAELVAEVVAQIAAGLAVAHAQDPPIVHRDLTPANVLVGYDGADLRLRVGDFGLARRADPAPPRGLVQGTCAFMAPEVLRGGGCSCASDVWSLGAIAYRLLTDHLPFDGGGPASPCSPARFTGRLLPPSRYNEAVDPGVDRVVMAALEVDPANRPATASELGAAVRELRERMARGRSGPGGPVSHESRGRITRGRSGPGSAPPPTAQPNQAPDQAFTSRPPAERPHRPAGRAQRLLDEALALSRDPVRLDHAADLLEEAIARSPRVRDLHLHRLALWRRGVMM